ncbi:MAG: Hsp20/alpha crystallin family protein [Bacteroidetes bacterium]|nr:MAG: Hsp20/alpha crystallin family protein [Bacteroidota bacterium]
MTKLVRLSPRADLTRMQHEFDRVFGNFFPSLGFSNNTDNSASWAPRIDVVETDDAFLFEFDVPGVDKEDIHVNLQEGILTVSGERKSRELEETEDVVRVERFTGHFYRSFSVPSAINEKNIEANYDRGVLSLRLPKAEESKPRKIKIS